MPCKSGVEHDADNHQQSQEQTSHPLIACLMPLQGLDQLLLSFFCVFLSILHVLMDLSHVLALNLELGVHVFWNTLDIFHYLVHFLHILVSLQNLSLSLLHFCLKSYFFFLLLTLNLLLFKVIYVRVFTKCLLFLFFKLENVWVFLSFQTGSVYLIYFILKFSLVTFKFVRMRIKFSYSLTVQRSQQVKALRVLSFLVRCQRRHFAEALHLQPHCVQVRPDLLQQACDVLLSRREIGLLTIVQSWKVGVSHVDWILFYLVV